MNLLDPRMVQLPHVKEYQEETVCQVLEDRCQELIVEDQEKFVSCEVVTPRVETSTSTTKKILGCTKQTKMKTPSDCVTEAHRGYPTLDRGGQSLEDVNFTVLYVHIQTNTLLSHVSHFGYGGG
jgi:hypothetical protein